MSSEAEVKVINPTPLLSFTSIDPRLQDFFESRDMACSWQPDNEQAMSMLYPRGFRAVQAADIEEEDPELFSYIKDAQYVNAAGRLQRDDCVLMVQPNEKREEELEYDRFLRKVRESGDRAKEEIDDYVSKHSRSSRAHFVSVPDSADVAEVDIAGEMDLPMKR